METRSRKRAAASSSSSSPAPSPPPLHLLGRGRDLPVPVLPRCRSLTSPAMEAGDPPTAPSPRPGPVPALSARFARLRRRLDSGGAPSATAPALPRPSSSAPGPSSTTRKKFSPCPPAGPPLPQPKPVAKKKTAAPRAKKGAPSAADCPPPNGPPPPPSRQPATKLAPGRAADSTVVEAHDPFDEMRTRDQAFKGVNSHLDMMDDSAAIDALRGTVLYHKTLTDQLCQEEAAAVTHIAPSADLADDLLINGVLPQLPDDLLVEILSRLPAKPVHRFKCVSKSWRDLISSPHHRKRLPQALAGFFYRSWCPGEKGHEQKLQFVNLSVRRPPLVNPTLAFLPNHASIVLADCCNGLLLLFSSYSQPRDYIVCNPATEKWVALPNSGVTGKHWFSVLAFDPAVSSHFHVLEYVSEVTNGKVGIFSSRTGGWSHRVKVCTDVFYNQPKTVFLNGMLHFICHREVMAIDLETKEWRHIQLPPKGLWSDFFGKSQGCLVYSCTDVDSLSLWTLEDYDTGAWSLKHRVSLL